MDFCTNCSNVLYPTEIENKLWLVCRFCEFKKEPLTSIIKKTVYKRDNINAYGSNKYLIYDKTYPRSKKFPCPNTDCPSANDKSLQEAIFFNDKITLKITFICAACNTEWKLS